MTYFAASIRPVEYPRLQAIEIRHQDAIVRQTGEPLVLPRTVDLLRTATNDFTDTENPLAQKVDQLLEQLLKAKGYVAGAKTPGAAAMPVDENEADSDPAGLFGGTPTAAGPTDKEKRLRLLRLREKERARKIAILKLKAASNGRT